MLQLSFYKKDLCCDQNLLCFVSLYHPGSSLVMVADDKTNISCLFCLISKLFTLSNIILNSTSRCWILITSCEWFLILNKKALNICSLFCLWLFFQSKTISLIALLFISFLSKRFFLHLWCFFLFFSLLFFFVFIIPKNLFKFLFWAFSCLNLYILIMM